MVMGFVHNVGWNNQVIYSYENTNKEPRDLYYSEEVMSKCGHMVVKLDDWDKDVRRDPNGWPTVSMAVHEGLGDRLGGIATNILFGMDHKKPINIYWPGLDAVFRFPKYLSQNSFRFRVDRPLSKCVSRRGVPDGLRCGEFMQGQHPKCWKSKSMLVHGQRMCANKKLCEDTLRYNKNTFNNVTAVSPVQTIGCALRVMLEPTESFLNRRFDWFVMGRILSFSVLELEEYLKDYTTIALHIRAGDPSFTFNTSTTKLHNFVKRSINCAQQVYDAGSREKPLAFLFASDSESERNKVREEFSSRVVMLMAKPVHIFIGSQAIRASKEQRLAIRRDENQMTFAEWKMIGAADETVLGTRFSSNRMSFFPYTSLLYHLKPYAYSVQKCIKKNIRTLFSTDVFKEQYHSTCNSNIQDLEMFNRLDTSFVPL